MKIENDVQLRVALYLRVSTDEQAEKYGLEAQRSAVEAIVKSRGKLQDGRDAMVLAGKAYEYIDDGVSGTIDIDQRPAFLRLKEDILNAPDGQKPFDIVAVYKIDRFARKLRILMDVMNFFEEYKVEFISASESIDTSTPFGRAMLGIMGVIAELERDTILERTQRGREEANKQGIFMGSHPPYGYQKNELGKLIKLEEEAEVVRQIFKWFIIDKWSPQKIADNLKERNILSPDASAVKNNKRRGISHKLNSPIFWRAEKVREILADDVYTGVRYYDKTKKNKILPKSEWKESPYRHDYIVLIHEFELAQIRLTDLSDRKTLTAKKEQGTLYLLSGLLKCDHCRKLGDSKKQDMMTWTGGKKLINKNELKYSYYYYCNRKNRKKFSNICPVVPIPADTLNKYIIKFVKKLLMNPKAVYDYQRNLASHKLSSIQLDKDRKNFESMFNALPSRRDNLRTQHEMGVMDTQAFEKEWKSLKDKELEYKTKIEEIDFKLTEFTISKGYEVSLNDYAHKYRESLDEIMTNEKELYELIHSLIHKIVVRSRPRNENDVIAGRKKGDQYIPNSVDIVLNLPQQLLQELYTQKFMVKSDDV